MAQQNEKPKTKTRTRDEKLPRDYNDLRSSYRHQMDTNTHAQYGNYNPASGTYENRLDDLTAETADLEFANEYQDQPQSSQPLAEDENEFRAMNGRGSGYEGNDQSSSLEQEERKKTQDLGYGQIQSDFRSIPGKEQDRTPEPTGEFGFDGDFSSGGRR